MLVRLLKLALLQLAILTVVSGCDSTPDGDSLAGGIQVGEELRFVPRRPGDTRAYVTNPRDGTLVLAPGSPDG